MRSIRGKTYASPTFGLGGDCVQVWGERTYRAFYENVVAWLESQTQGEWECTKQKSLTKYGRR